MISAFLEISTLFEKNWTGLAVVTAALAKSAINDDDIEWVFFCESIVVPHSLVCKLLKYRGATEGRESLLASLWNKQDISYFHANKSRAVFGFLKSQRSLFREEASIVYDLSPLIVSKFHNTESSIYFADRFRKDVETSKHFFCISEATKNDLNSYFSVTYDRITTIPMGVDLNPYDVSTAQTILQKTDIEPYVLILGTLEPRKNGQIIFRHLATDPGFAKRFRIVFVGRSGWLGERERLLREAVSAGINDKRVIFTGFLNELEKTALIQNASFCIYPSYFEGYGLPILEAATLQQIIVCSRNSSMPEVAPSRSYFFDPDNIHEFRLAMNKAERRSLQMRNSSFLPEITGRISMNSWSACYDIISAWVSRP